MDDFTATPQPYTHDRATNHNLYLRLSIKDEQCNTLNRAFNQPYDRDMCFLAVRLRAFFVVFVNFSRYFPLMKAEVLAEKLVIFLTFYSLHFRTQILVKRDLASICVTLMESCWRGSGLDRTFDRNLSLQGRVVPCGRCEAGKFVFLLKRHNLPILISNPLIATLLTITTSFTG